MDAAMRVAVIDIGTNSTRLLIADVEGTGVHEIERRTAVTNMGRGVDHSSLICSDAVEDVCGVIADYKARYEEQGAERTMAFATSAVRDAVNGDAFIAELRERFGLDARLLTGEEEARLTYLGATAHRQETDATLVFDIGGGSTELIVGSGAEVGFHASLQAGTIRQSERHLTSDPPDPHELEDLAADIRNLIDRAIAAQPEGRPIRAIAVAGTPTSLAAIDQELEPYDPGRVHGYHLGMRRVQRMLSRLASLPLAERLRVPGLHPGRAPTIVTGTVILVQVMRAFGMQEVEVSELDILHGSALSAAMAPA
ncbi:MAG: exopolyphosphatase / guanosine-5-triphosphate,3-diphosphate pyrophosphatase [Solirubrobacterales bacterium]|jgi:exopolyphosphatase/guanosine-5'-triphosphate,3'-diphosphate pyrophosphatase|nr:exopolyphosphatase / guanosine-5-triphosphate,3-diphosphate pyrophosphatase [Solirubrobacterales bacterium]